MLLDTNKKFVKSKLENFIAKYKDNLNKQRKFAEANHKIEEEARTKLGISALTLRHLTLQGAAFK